jgi:hypothetical protein
MRPKHGVVKLLYRCLTPTKFEGNLEGVSIFCVNLTRNDAVSCMHNTSPFLDSIVKSVSPSSSQAVLSLVQYSILKVITGRGVQRVQLVSQHKDPTDRLNVV